MNTLPPCENIKRLRWEITRLTGSHRDDAIQEAWLAYLEGRNPLSAAKVYANRLTRERARNATIQQDARGEFLAIDPSGKKHELPAPQQSKSAAALRCRNSLRQAG
jgi:hypothetical protein